MLIALRISLNVRSRSSMAELLIIVLRWCQIAGTGSVSPCSIAGRRAANTDMRWVDELCWLLTSVGRQSHPSEFYMNSILGCIQICSIINFSF